jgi:acetyl esterase/lipase
MARGSLRRLAALLALLIVTACSAEESHVTTTTNPAPSESTTTTTLAATTSFPDSPTTTDDDTEPIDAEVMVPDGEGPFPAVVLVHGGGWVAGAPRLMAPLARHLTENGFLTVSAAYTLASRDRPGYPAAVEDVACAVRFAALHPDSNGTVAVIGHSAGAHIGALVSLVGDRYRGDCPLGGPGLPNLFVGLAGPYDVTRLGIAVAGFFGGPPDRLPEVWEAGNPINFAAENSDLDTLIMYGELDGIVVDGFAIDFHNALVDAGVDSLLEQIPGARHNDVHNPTLVGDLIVAWLERER